MGDTRRLGCRDKIAKPKREDQRSESKVLIILKKKRIETICLVSPKIYEMCKCYKDIQHVFMIIDECRVQLHWSRDQIPRQQKIRESLHREARTFFFLHKSIEFDAHSTWNTELTVTSSSLNYCIRLKVIVMQISILIHFFIFDFPIYDFINRLVSFFSM